MKLLTLIVTLAWLGAERRATAALQRALSAERCYRRSLRPRHEPEVMVMREGAAL